MVNLILWQSVSNRLTRDKKSDSRLPIQYLIAYMLFYALIKQTKPLKQSSDAHFAIFDKDGLF